MGFVNDLIILDKLQKPEADESSDEAKGVSSPQQHDGVKQLPQIINIKNAVGGTRPDDTYSELTFTDTIVESGTNNSGDSVTQSGASVASSSASSLPSLKSVRIHK